MFDAMVTEDESDRPMKPLSIAQLRQLLSGSAVCVTEADGLGAGTACGGGAASAKVSD